MEGGGRMLRLITKISTPLFFFILMVRAEEARVLLPRRFLGRTNGQLLNTCAYVVPADFDQHTFLGRDNLRLHALKHRRQKPYATYRDCYKTEGALKQGLCNFEHVQCVRYTKYGCLKRRTAKTQRAQGTCSIEMEISFYRFKGGSKLRD